jgi:2-polyprenyl-3-methyl-5-hydroxy-6-metoxy-1,4-benzoquinol methylase
MKFYSASTDSTNYFHVKISEMTDTNHFSSCLLCNSSNIVPLEKYKNAYLVKCQDCSFVFSNKRPNLDELKECYGKYPTDFDISPITIARYEDLLKKFEPFRKTNNILDVGCGEGYFLDIAKKNKWNVYGTEFREDAAKRCSEKDIKMHNGILNTLQCPTEHFDIITSFEVLEHINNPREEAGLFVKLLRPGGLLYITTPNFNSLSRYILSAKWNVIDYPEHLSYYTLRTVSSLFRFFNLEVIDHSSTGVSITRFIQSSMKDNPNSVPENYDENIRQATESNILLRSGKMIINSLLTLTNTGDALKVFIKKPS